MCPDEEEYEAPVEALDGSATPSSGAQEVAGMLLGLIGEIPKLHVMLLEADEEEFGLLLPRLRAFLDLVGQLPTSPNKRRKPMGFEVKRKKKR